MDTLTIKSLRLKGRHGVFPEERLKDTVFEVDMVFMGNFLPAGRADDLNRTVDYLEAESIAASVFAGPSRLLIETLCLQIGEALNKRYPELQGLEVAIRKLTPAIDHPADYSEIRMQWPRS